MNSFETGVWQATYGAAIVAGNRPCDAFVKAAYAVTGLRDDATADRMPVREGNYELPVTKTVRMFEDGALVEMISGSPPSPGVVQSCSWGGKGWFYSVAWGKDGNKGVGTYKESSLRTTTRKAKK